MDYIELGYIGLFLGCFLSATIIPFASEGIFLFFIYKGFDPYTSLFVATLGNSLGGSTNYIIGLLGKEEKILARIKNPKRFLQFSAWIKRYGYWSALLTWLPFLGDPLTIVLGFFRVPIIPTMALMTFGKFARYAVILYFAL